jgi:uncharacterized membrane protein
MTVMEKTEQKPQTIKGGLRVERVMTIRRPADELYRYWRDFEHLPLFMKHLQSVRVMDDGRSHWVTNAPGGGTVEWDAEIVDDKENELIMWRSLEGSDIANAGSVRFEPAPADRGTEVRVSLHYEAPGGKLGSSIAKLMGEEPSHQIFEDMMRFKMLMEAGEVATTEGQPRADHGDDDQDEANRADGSDGRNA